MGGDSGLFRGIRPTKRKSNEKRIGGDSGQFCDIIGR